MSDRKPVEREQPDEAVTEQARQSLEQAEAGNTSRVQQLDNIPKGDPAGVEAAEQEASDGPEGLGRAR